MSLNPKATLLVVDDTPTNLRIMTKVLSGAGYQVIVATGSAAALELALSIKPDLILLDVMMPEVDGLETCRRLRAGSATKDIPVLFTTALAETSDKLRGFQAGGLDYITKPYQAEEVLARVATHLTLARQKRELAALLEERSRFMRIAAHDLRNPLSTITSSIHLGRLDKPSPVTAKALQRIESAARRMNAIIEDFLSLRLLEDQSDPGLGLPFDLIELIGQVLEQQAFAAASKRIELHWEKPAGTTPACGNRSRCHQILTNYVSNALKYSPAGTRVTVSAALTTPRWRVEVRDQGPGVREAERGKLFLEFAKISNLPTGGETSSGLGLAIVKRLAEAQGGVVGADFPADGGSVFWVELPATATP
ncbi:MAG: hybrid sensor histidine kinase/response regulator [Verrucomicrobiota bacterium]|jgi:signal transduction histidine kinase